MWTPDGLTTAGTATLRCDQYPDQVYTATVDGPRFLWTLPPETLPWGAWLTVSGVPGYLDYAARCVIDHDITDIALDASLERIDTQGRQFRTESGARFRWRGASGFRLLEWLATGHADVAETYLAWAAREGITVVRVFTMARYMFTLAPEVGRAVLGQALARAATHGLYLEVVCLADTASYTFDHATHVEQVGAICAEHLNSVIEIANEPDHSTQDPRVHDPEYLLRLAARVPGSVVVALGASHGPGDESRAYIGGDYVTVHGDRADGEDGWRPVRHTNEQRALSEDVGKVVVNDEPSRDMTPDKHLAMALLCAMHGLGDTFHYAEGKDARPATGADAVCLAQRVRGWDAVPVDWWGVYQNAGWAGSPVKEFTGALRLYSSINGHFGYTLGLDCSDATQVRWNDGWSAQLLIAEGGTRWWSVRR